MAAVCQADIGRVGILPEPELASHEKNLAKAQAWPRDMKFSPATGQAPSFQSVNPSATRLLRGRGGGGGTLKPPGSWILYKSHQAFQGPDSPKKSKKHLQMAINRLLQTQGLQKPPKACPVFPARALDDVAHHLLPEVLGGRLDTVSRP